MPSTDLTNVTRPPHEENEARILAFRRENLFEGVQMARVALRKGESSTFHLHTKTRDVFFVMSGRLTITVRLGSSFSTNAYDALSSMVFEIHRASNGDFVHRLRVLPGEVVVVHPGTVHCAANVDDEPCHFLCIEGVGPYDFVGA
jgi:mannose-6-phosphate isomerase-like protein (cupin superfamily)